MLITLIIFPSFGFGAETPNPEQAAGSGWYQEAMTRIQEEEYEVTWQEQSALPGGKPGYHITNRAQDLRLYFSSDGISAIRRTGSQPTWILGWSLCFDLSDKALPCLKSDIIADKNRIQYRRKGILEQYENLTSGIHQTLVLEETVKGSASLKIIVTFNGNMTPGFEQGDTEIEFLYDNKAVLGFKDIKANDAQGNRLPLHIALEGNQLVMTIDDGKAVYPVRMESVLASLTPWSMEGNRENALFGSSVATAGDVNGDGYSDIIIGAPNYDNGEVKEGKAFVYHGGPTGPGASSNFSYESNQVYAEMGCSVSTAGDINKDGYSDALVGAKYYADGQNDEGLVFIFKGSASGLYYFNTQGNNDEGAHFGSSVAPAGDFDGDGYADIIVGAPSRSNNEGAVFLYYGTESGYFGSVTGIFSGSTSQMGCSVCTAGDVDGDGYGDLIFGASTYSNEQTDEGKVYVYFGKDTGIKTDWNYEYNYSTIHLGSSVSTAGDVNGDGYADVIVGAPDYTNLETHEGMVLIFYGHVSGLSNAPDLKIESHQTQAHFGSSVSLAGDWNGDGYADVIVGAPGYQSDVDHVEEGAAYIFRGSSSGLKDTYDWFERSDQANARFGTSVSTAGDVNGDGFSDVLVGAPAYDGGLTDEGKCFLYYGKPKPPTTYPDWNTENAVVDCDFAMTVAGAGDVNADGYADIMVGAPLYDNGQTDEGRVFIYHGKSHNVPDAAANLILEPDLTNAHFGEALASAGDVNGDGYDDILIGAPQYNSKQGYAYIYYGSDTGIDPSAYLPMGGTPGSQFGKSVSGAGDVNGDGYTDIIVSAPYYPGGGVASGFVWINHGSPSGIMGDGLLIYGDQVASYFGYSVSTAGDVNGDGYSDVIVGAPYYDNGQTEEGRVYVYYGSHNGVRTDSPWIVEANKGTSLFGYSVSTAGDVNGDGYSDVIIGAPYYDNGNIAEGAAFIYLGWPTGLFKTPIAMLDEANQDNAMFGYSVAAAGDVNGDGFSDVILGAYLHDNQIISATTRPIINREDAGSAYIYLGSSSGPSITSDWSGHFLQGNGHYGRCVAGAGDVNGDGFADVIIGAPGYTSGPNKLGRASLYLGGGGNGRLKKPTQNIPQSPYSIIPHLGKSDQNAFTIGILTFSPFGKGGLGYEFEVKEFLTPFDGTNTVIWKTYGDITGVTRFYWDKPENLLYHWRGRVLYDPVNLPYQSHGPWITIPWNGWQEADFRTGPTATPSLQDIINYLLGKSHYQHDMNGDTKTDASDVVEYLIP
jgi:hypothetical protein